MYNNQGTMGQQPPLPPQQQQQPPQQYAPPPQQQQQQYQQQPQQVIATFTLENALGKILLFHQCNLCEYFCSNP